MKHESARADLDSLLREDLPTAVRRERETFDLAAGAFRDRIVLHGAGRFGKTILSGLRQLSIEPVAFTDNNPELHGKYVDGVPVFSPQIGSERFGRTASFVITVWNSAATDTMSQRIDQLRGLGCERVMPAGLLCWKHADIFLPYYPLDLPHKVLLAAPEAEAAFEVFEDEPSRTEYIGQMRFRLLLDYDAFTKPFRHDQYFQSDLYELGPNEVMIDCGAYDGDSIASFVQLQGAHFDRIVAFEPDPQNWSSLQNRLNAFPSAIRSRVTAFSYALGAEAATVQFNSTGTEIARIGEGIASVRRVALDEVLQDFRPSFIKFDIEGAELDALQGARRVIASHRPIMVVSCYHQQNHLWEVPILLADLCRDYKFFLRPHGAEGWDLLCYAVPVERLK